MHIITTNQNISQVQEILEEFIEQKVESLSRDIKRIIHLYDNSPVRFGCDRNLLTTITSYKNILQKSSKEKHYISVAYIKSNWNIY